MRRGVVRALVGALAVAGAAACTVVVPPPPDDPPTQPDSDPSAALATDCNPVRVGSCALPWPSDLFTEAGTTATGRRVVVGDETLSSAVLDELPDPVHPSAVYEGADGFSPSGPVLFELPLPPDPATLPGDGGTALQVYDYTTGARVPVTVQLLPESSYRGGSVVAAWPQTRYSWKHRYVAVLTDSMRPYYDAEYTPSSAMDEAIRGRGSLGSYHKPFVEFLNKRGVSTSQIVSVTAFTVRSEDDATGQLRSMAATAYSQEHPITVEQVDSNFLTDLLGFSAIVTGKVRLTSFRGEGGEIVYAPGSAGAEEWVDYVLTLPAERTTADGVVIYGHGLGVIKETMIVVASENAANGLATIGIDQPNHGTRGDQEGGNFWSLMTPDQVARLTAIPAQSVIDSVSLLKAVETSVAALDVLPVAQPDGAADALTERIYYEGTSMGGVLGASFVAVAPTLDGAFLQVAGGGIIHILANSSLWGGAEAEPGDPAIRLVVPASASAAEAAAMLAGVQQMLDAADPLGFAPHWKSPFPGISAKPVALVYGMEDGIVFNPASEALAGTAGLPWWGPVLYPAPFFTYVGPDQPADGTGVMQISTSEYWEFLQAYLAHISFLKPEAVEELDVWLANRMAGPE